MLIERLQRSLERRLVIADTVAVLFVVAYQLTVGRPILTSGWLVAIGIAVARPSGCLACSRLSQYA